MNEKRFLAAVTLLFALLLGACSGKPESPPLEGAALGGPFTLVNQDGRTLSDTDFAGKYRIVYFGFTYCPDVCPVDLQSIGQAMRLLEKSDPAVAEKVQPIFITVDPERDTPPVLRQYVSAFHPKLVGLTGTPQQIAEVAKRYGVYYAKKKDPSAAEYLMDHSRVTLLFGPKGEPIAILPHEKGAEGIAAEIRRWVT